MVSNFLIIRLFIEWHIFFEKCLSEEMEKNIPIGQYENLIIAMKQPSQFLSTPLFGLVELALFSEIL